LRIEETRAGSGWVVVGRAVCLETSGVVAVVVVVSGVVGLLTGGGVTVVGAGVGIGLMPNEAK
jgi:hypothetical protein